VTPDLWGQVERFVKASAKRAATLPQFIEALKPRLACATVKPKWIAVGAHGEMPVVAVQDPHTGTLRHIVKFAARDDLREFGTRVIERADAKSVLARLYRETAWCVLLCRDRLERERPIEQQLNISRDDDDEEGETHA